MCEVAQELNLGRRMVKEILRNDLCIKKFWKIWPQDFFSEEKAKVTVDCSMFCLLRDLLNSVL